MNHQLDESATIYESKADPLAPRECPLCMDIIGSFKLFDSHVGSHLVDITPFALRDESDDHHANDSETVSDGLVPTVAADLNQLSTDGQEDQHDALMNRPKLQSEEAMGEKPARQNTTKSKDKQLTLEVMGEKEGNRELKKQSEEEMEQKKKSDWIKFKTL